eukprot:TRINITY_DN6294_c0_g1_i1.p1 TRINITY_DN6294_c0_g1~~TRINITY_DN6294_c0_g1_i1.p1  ORF type:complete len:142 (+),score=36.94 TRINITY_DN6294_c0_g1_i1:95-520(+)
MAVSDSEIKECFTTFDTDKDGKIFAYDMGTVIRALGKAPLQEEVKKMEEEAGDALIDFTTFKKFYQRKMKRPNDYENDMKQAFEALDALGNREITEADLRMMLGTLGEPLEAEELDGLMRCVDVNSQGNISYDDFIALLLK